MIPQSSDSELLQAMYALMQSHMAPNDEPVEEDTDEEDNDTDEDEDLLDRIRKHFNLASETSAQNRQEMVDDIEFARLGNQWPQSAKDMRSMKGAERPMLVVNRLLQFRDKVVNEIRQNTPSIRYRPVASGADQETAEVLMGLVRHIQDNSNASIAYDTAVEWQVDAGLGYIRVRNDWSDPASFDQEIFIDRIVDPLKIYYDPHSKQPDGSDAEWCIVAEEIPREEFKRLYPGVEQTQWAFSANGDNAGWFSRDAIRIAEYYWIEHEKQEIQSEDGRTRTADVRKCMWVKCTGDTILERSELPTKYIPIVPVLGYEVWLNGRRYLSGLVRNAKDSQRLYNYYNSANAEHIALSPKAPFIGVAGQFENDPNWGTANSTTHAYLEYDPVTIAGTPAGPPQRANPPTASSAITQAIQFAGQDIMQSMGIYQPSLGDQSNETSGRALLLRQKQAETGNFHFQDNLSRSIRQVGRIVLDMIPHVYDRARVVRILGEDGSTQTVNIDPSLPQASAYTDRNDIESIYNPSVGTYDVVCDSGPSYSTKRDEAANMMLALTQANPSLFNMIGDLMLKNMDWPGAEEISKRLQAMLPPGLQPSQDGTEVDPIRQQMEQAMHTMASQMEHMGQEIQQLRDERLLRIQAEEREWFDAETKRMDVEGKLMMTDRELQTAVQQNLLMMMGQQPAELAEEQGEMEQMESTLQQPEQPPGGPPQAGPPQGAPPQGGPPLGAPAGPKRRPGAMTRKPDIEALTGEVKPGEGTP